MIDVFGPVAWCDIGFYLCQGCDRCRLYEALGALDHVLQRDHREDGHCSEPQGSWRSCEDECGADYLHLFENDSGWAK